jgi:PAS domain S-box-containing protein
MLFNGLLDGMFMTGAGLFAVDQDQRIIFWNQGAQAILGHTPDDMVGQTCFEVMRALDESGQPNCMRACPVFDREVQKEPVSGQNLLVKTKDGTFRWLSMVYAFVASPDEGFSAVVHIFRDVTPEVEAKRLLGRIVDQITGFRFSQRGEAGAHGPETELTEREKQVLVLLAQGDGTDPIAKKLTISNSTARNHIQNVLVKLGVHTRLEAVAYAMKRKVIEPGWPNEQ